MCPLIARTNQAHVMPPPYYAHQAQVVPAPFYTSQAYQVQTYQPPIPQSFAPHTYAPQVPQLMAPQTATAQVPAIQAPQTNQAAPTPQGSNGRAFMTNVNQAESSSDVVNGTFSINNHSAFVLFDTGDKSFISLDFAYIIDKPWDRLSKPFTVEVPNGNSITIDSVIRYCAIVLNIVKFRIDLIPIQMGSFDVIVGMDWLTLNHVEVVCFDKFLRIPLQDGRILKYIAFFALVVEKEKEKKKIQDIPIVRDFPNVFPEDVVGLPLIRQVEFRIDLVPGANPVAKAPYRLAPSEMQELSSQLQELSDKGFIRPSSSSWGTPV
ncbi:uncharacterized protein LOC143535535 [Bidens hawaiensis]|uniref:uncharacterized protein LOC143535535 n=1 Tax=Bidens hawaiensis TaxID=980011 RepID=UPI00404B2F21